MNLEIKQKHQFSSIEHNKIFDILEISNKEVYYNIDQINSLFAEKFDEYLKTQPVGPDNNSTYYKACQYFDIYGYATSEDFEKDMVLEIRNEKWYSFSYLCPYIAKHDKELSRQLCEFYRKLNLFVGII